MKTRRQLTEDYFHFFNNRDINSLKELYSQNISLIDWVGEWEGIDSVLKENEGLFSTNFKLKVIRIDEIGNRTYNQILIHINGEDMKVIDVIDFDTNFKIQKIQAYKG